MSDLSDLKCLYYLLFSIYSFLLSKVYFSKVRYSSWRKKSVYGSKMSAEMNSTQEQDSKDIKNLYVGQVDWKRASGISPDGVARYHRVYEVSGGLGSQTQRIWLIQRCLLVNLSIKLSFLSTRFCPLTDGKCHVHTKTSHERDA